MAISPWWASLFEEGATSDWHFEYHHTEAEVDEAGEWQDTVDERKETDVRCTVARVHREGDLLVSNVTCQWADPSLRADHLSPEGEWMTDGTRLYRDTEPPDEPMLTDPPIAANVGTEFEPAFTSLYGDDQWCYHYSPIDGGNSRCFRRGVGPVSYSSESAPSGRTTTESLRRK